MADIKPFYGITPQADLAERIAALPYDVYDRQEAKEEVAKHPLSFLRIDRAETQFGDEVDTYDPKVYQKAHDLLWNMIDKGEFQKEKSPCYYLYELTMNGRSQTGIVACASVDDYVNGVIMKHENTREDKEQDRIRHVDACDAQTGPIFLAYRHNDTIHGILQEVKKEEPMFDFLSEDGIRHRGWRIGDAEKICSIQKAFQDIHQIYIADGHHRAASAVKVSLKRRKESEKAGEHDTFLSVLFEDDELYIMDYNRVVADLNRHSIEGFLQEISKVCQVLESTTQVKPEKKGEVGMYLAGKWYRLTFREDVLSEDPVDGLDVSVLQKQILSPILGIGDPRTDQRISFVGGIRGLHALEKAVHDKGGVAFAMFPTSMQELFAVADAGRLMPPKSTWFEPKLRSGLFIHALR